MELHRCDREAPIDDVPLLAPTQPPPTDAGDNGQAQTGDGEHPDGSIPRRLVLFNFCRGESVDGSPDSAQPFSAHNGEGYGADGIGCRNPDDDEEETDSNPRHARDDTCPHRARGEGAAAHCEGGPKPDMGGEHHTSREGFPIDPDLADVITLPDRPRAPLNRNRRRAVQRKQKKFAKKGMEALNKALRAEALANPCVGKQYAEYRSGRGEPIAAVPFDAGAFAHRKRHRGVCNGVQGVGSLWCANPRCPTARDPQRGEAAMRCGRCKCISYCGAECQREHWALHKPMCRPATPLDLVVRKTVDTWMPYLPSGSPYVGGYWIFDAQGKYVPVYALGDPHSLSMLPAHARRWHAMGERVALVVRLPEGARAYCRMVFEEDVLDKRPHGAEGEGSAMGEDRGRDMKGSGDGDGGDVGGDVGGEGNDEGGGREENCGDGKERSLLREELLSREVVPDDGEDVCVCDDAAMSDVDGASEGQGDIERIAQVAVPKGDGSACDGHERGGERRR